MKLPALDLDQLLLAFAASAGFAGSTWAFKQALDTQDRNWLIGAVAALMLSYIPYLTLLGQSMSGTIVVTSMMSQVLALSIAFGVYGETLTAARAIGLAAAIVAIAAFTLPVAARHTAGH